MKVIVVGMGYVGSVTAGVFAREGHEVVGVDIHPAKLKALERGVAPVTEPGLAELIKRAHFAGHFRATADLATAVPGADVIMLCVGTPSLPSGAVDTQALERVCEQLGGVIRNMGNYPVVTVRSTALPEVIEDKLLPILEERSGTHAGERFGFAVNPEFLREGSAIADFDQPEFTLVGTDEARTASILERLYAFLDAPFVRIDRRSACFVKYANNAFHALKVAFANEIDTVCRRAGVDGTTVMELVRRDRKLNVSAAYLKPGAPFGGSCLPKDLRALVQYGGAAGIPTPLLRAALQSNEARVQTCIDLVLQTGARRIAVLGMAFKAGTDDLRESPMVTIIETLLGKGLKIAVYDASIVPSALVGANLEYVQTHLPHLAVLLGSSIEEVISSAETIIVATRDPAFAEVPRMAGDCKVVIDLAGVCRPSDVVRTTAATAES